MDLRISNQHVLIQSLLNHQATLTGGFLFSRKHTVISMFKFLTKKKSIKEIISDDLDDARRELLKQQAAALYHAKMMDFYQQTISRLSNQLNQE
jgi:hypothetical protein